MGRVTIRLGIEALGFETFLGFLDEPAYRLGLETLFAGASGARLPPLVASVDQTSAEPELTVEIRPRGTDLLDVRFRGAVESPEYVAQRDGFHWDFSKVLSALVMTHSIASGLVPVHGAALETPVGAVLLPGASGAGKSSTAYAALLDGVGVLGSELAFVRGDVIRCANSALTVDRPALDRFGLSDVLSGDPSTTTKLVVPLPARPPERVTRLCFVQVTDGPLRLRPLTGRRARMLLFENVLTQMPMTQLLSQETWPIWLPPTRDQIESSLETIFTLAALEPVHVEGHPRAIVRHLAGSTGT